MKNPSVFTTFLEAVVYLFVLVATESPDEDVDISLRQHKNWNLLPHSECGIRKLPDIGPRVIGGRTAKPGEFPWMVKFYSDNEDDEPMCSSSIISEKYIITAAHCCTFFTENGVKPSFGAGTNNIKMSQEEKRITAEEVIIHPQYIFHKDKTTENDLCLIRLRKPFIFTDVIKPICLPIYKTMKQRRIDGTILETAGWGFISPGEKVVASGLQTTRLQVFQPPKCGDVNHRDNFCAIALDTAASKGDSGGPLMFKSAGGRYFIFGITSFGNGTKRLEIGGFWVSAYPKVYNYIIWILDNMKP